MLRKSILIALIISALMLSLINFYQNVIKYTPVTLVTEDQKEAAPEDEVLTVAHGAWKEDILKLNIFSPTRSFAEKREPVVKIEPLIEKPVKRPELKLMGIVLNQYDEFVALIEKDGQMAPAVRVGENLEDIEVLDIKEDSVSLLWNRETINLMLRRVKRLD
jgi:hypothetical protein